MPRPPASFASRSPLGGASRTRSVGSEGSDGQHVQTPEPKRRRCSSSNSDQNFVSMLVRLSDNRSRCCAVAKLEDRTLVECLAMLAVEDIICSSMVATAWHKITEERLFWDLVALNIGLADRIVHRQYLCKRRSRGTIWRGVLFGGSAPQRRQQVALRSVNLSEANAGTDDGLLPSIVREVALLRSLSSAVHPAHRSLDRRVCHAGCRNCEVVPSVAPKYVVGLVDVEVEGDLVHIATEYLPSSFAAWFAAPRPPSAQLLSDITARFSQLFCGLEFLHSRGIIHRNLVPSNVLLDPVKGIVKISDFARARAFDVPLRCYSPEDPKMRNQSTREARRLWYKAPELLLRQEIYGPAVDIWSVGCLLAEVSLGEPLFPSDCEVDHLFRVFRFSGTPSQNHWPDALAAARFSPTFPQYEPVDLTLAYHVMLGCTVSALTLQSLLRNRQDVEEMVVKIAVVLRFDGINLLSDLLQLDPASRMEAREAHSRHREFFEQHRTPSSLPEKDRDAGYMSTRRYNTPQCKAHMAADSCNSLRPTLWAAMAGLVGEYSCLRTKSLHTCMDRVRKIDYIVSFAKKVEVSWDALHIAVALFDDINSKMDLPGCTHEASRQGAFATDPFLLGAVCLKIAEAFDMHSHEYFVREKTASYVNAVGGRWSAAMIVRAERWVAQQLHFHFHRPTAAWFLRVCASMVGIGFDSAAHTIGLARFILDLCLLDADMLAYPAPLRAQASLLLAVYLTLAVDFNKNLDPLDITQKICSVVEKFWEPIQRATVGFESKGMAVSCLVGIANVLVTQRHRWKARGFVAVERLNSMAVRSALLLQPLVGSVCPQGNAPAMSSSEALPNLLATDSLRILSKLLVIPPS